MVWQNRQNSSQADGFLNRNVWLNYFPKLVALAMLGLAACTATVETPQASVDEPSQAEDRTQQTTATASSASAARDDKTPKEVIEDQLESAVTPDNPDMVSQSNGSASDHSPLSNLDTPPVECDLTTQAAINSCAQEDYAQADAQLNRVYQALKSAQSESGRQALGTAEVAWLRFRDLDCAFESNQFTGGSMAPLVYSNCLRELTIVRTQELQQPALPDISYKVADGQLNQTYQALMGVLPLERRNTLTEAQLAWLEYRDRNCAFEALYSDQVIEETQCMARMSAIRAAQLKADLQQNDL
ncbi:MAG: DUF1311 domain-containing protein [Phormidesmis sp. RL_2_1]|nr:DUF1311 domain-containing protein [Phormidesmis sp. RL_2_1]